MSQLEFPITEILVSPVQNPVFHAKAILHNLERLASSSSSTKWRSLTPLDSHKNPIADPKSIGLHLSWWYQNLNSPKANEEKAWNVLNYILKIADGIDGFKDSAP
jgi:hypothetical protein